MHLTKIDARGAPTINNRFREMRRDPAHALREPFRARVNVH
jgi:hypothetical protein